MQSFKILGFLLLGFFCLNLKFTTKYTIVVGEEGSNYDSRSSLSVLLSVTVCPRLGGAIRNFETSWMQERTLSRWMSGAPVWPVRHCCGVPEWPPACRAKAPHSCGLT